MYMFENLLYSSEKKNYFDFITTLNAKAIRSMVYLTQVPIFIKKSRSGLARLL